MKLFVTTNWPPDYNFGGVVYSGYSLFHSMKSIDDSWMCISTASVKCTERDVLTSVFHGSGKHGISFKLFIDLVRAISRRNLEYVFINGSVTFPTISAQLLCLIFNKKYVVSTRGALEPWRLEYKKAKKRFYFKFLVIPLLKRAKWIHVTGELEKSYVLAKAPKENVVVVPNGISDTKYLKNSNFGRIKLLFLSRISPEKGIDILSEIVNEIQKKNLNLELTIVGPGAKQAFVDSDGVRVFDGIYGSDKIKLFEECDIFILPSYSENFGNVILESLAYGRPVITTTKTPWKEIISYDCGWQINPTSSDFLNLLNQIQFIDRSKLVEMGQNGIKLSQNFIWDHLAKIIISELNGI